MVHHLVEPIEGQPGYRTLMLSDQQSALILVAASMANGRQCFVWDEDGPRQCGAGSVVA